jgi:putative nucleotidyltransferase with HDIG domain
MDLLPRWLVESGSFEVAGAKPLLLEALLGSCVGVAITDKKAHIGGLYHILLPEHSSDSLPFADTLYARTGMPRFLEALRNAGASFDRMEATIAGGALIGNLSQIDLQLDVGGKTVEVVQQSLREAGIPVTGSETGGFFGTLLRLDLQSLECRIEPAYTIDDTDASAIAPLTEDELASAIAAIKPIPQVALKIIRTIHSGDYSLKDIARQIRHDQVISAKVLNICNSAYLAHPTEIKSIDQALVMLGADLLLQLILSTAMEGFFRSSNRGYSMSKGGTYHHAVSTAIVSEHIARLTGKAEPDIAYTAGLLHDIGKVLLDQYVGRAAGRFYSRLYSDGEDLMESEQALLGITHAEAGARLAEMWSFPAALRDVIRYHGRPELAGSDADLTHVVYLADLLLSRFDPCHELEKIDTRELGERLKRLGLDSGSLPDLIGRIPWNSLNVPGYF